MMASGQLAGATMLPARSNPDALPSQSVRGAAMRGPPDLKSERAALAGSPNLSTCFHTPDNDIELANHQARSLQSRFAVGYHFASAIAPLVGGLPR